MNREIKFRALVKTSSKMIEVQGVTENFVFENTLNGCDPNENVFSRKDCLLMQFTGLSDMNGKEIYEGDIVIPTDNNCEPYFTHSQVIVEWSDEICGFKLGHVSNTMSIYYKYEVIGNIFENPEMLLVTQAIT